MAVSKDAFRQFQEELDALDRKIEQQRATERPADPPITAKAEFLAWRERHGLSVADVVALFPPEEGVQYLLRMIQAPPPAKARRGRPPKSGEPRA